MGGGGGGGGGGGLNRSAFFNSKSESCFRIRIPFPRFIINVKIMILNHLKHLIFSIEAIFEII